MWKGSLAFGLVNVPVGLYPATEDRTVHFNQLQSGTSDRVRYKKVNERTGEEVAQRDIVKGFSLGSGEYVVLSDDELSTADPERTRSIGILDFVDLSDIDPVFYRSTYYLAPEGEPAQKAYALLCEAMSESGKVAIATLVMRNKEYLVTIRPSDGVLVLQTMFFSDEVRSPGEELPNLPREETFTDRERSIAQLLIDSMTVDWEPEKYTDTHREKVEQLIEQKREGKEIVVQAEVPQPKVVDLMAALTASVKAVEGNKSGMSKAQPAASDQKAPTEKKVPRKKAS